MSKKIIIEKYSEDNFIVTWNDNSQSIYKNLHDAIESTRSEYENN